jgi:hypothetical protein
MPVVQQTGTATVTTTETTLGAAITGNINLGGMVDLTSMAANNQAVVINVYAKVISGGADVLFDQHIITERPSLLAYAIDPIPVPYGCTVKIYRIGGSNFSAGYNLSAV